MSNDLISGGFGPLRPQEIVPADLSERLNTDWSYGPHLPEVKQRIQVKLDQLQPWARPVPADLVRLWIKPLVAGVRPDLTAEQMVAWFDALMLTVGHLEVGGFNPETQRTLLSRCRFWPTPADVYEVVVGPCVRIRRDIEGLRRALAAPTKEESR